MPGYSEELISSIVLDQNLTVSANEAERVSLFALGISGLSEEGKSRKIRRETVVCGYT